MLRDMFLDGAAYLEKNREIIDALNVFPVPDGDTGSNMFMTMQGAVKELRTMPPSVTVGEVTDAVARGALRGARGNSGVILSQLFRGFDKAAKGSQTMDTVLLAQALSEGTQAAYKAVMRPKEGTILTVSRMIADAALAAVEKEETDMEALISVILSSGKAALALTPELLPVLKEAGVIDSGGKGLLTIYYGFAAAFAGEEIEWEEPEEALPQSLNDAVDVSIFSTETIDFAYCTEFFIIHRKDEVKEEDIECFREHLIRIGDSVVVAADDEIIKVHVHSNAPGKILQFAMRLGELDHLKIENMLEQNRQLLEARRRSQTEYAMVAVSSGEGMDGVFTDLSVSRVISGGQTMNPSIDTIVSAIRQANARHVFVLPNNSNIILAAQQAGELCDCEVIVLPTKTLPQGISAALAFDPEVGVEENTAGMTSAFSEVLSGAVTYAIRDTSFSGKKIASGDIIGMIDNKLTVVDENVEDASLQLLREMIAKKGIDDPVVTIFYGDSVEEDAAEKLVESLQDDFEDAEFVVQNGGQPLYYYYFSVE